MHFLTFRKLVFFFLKMFLQLFMQISGKFLLFSLKLRKQSLLLLLKLVPHLSTLPLSSHQLTLKLLNFLPLLPNLSHQPLIFPFKFLETPLQILPHPFPLLLTLHGHFPDNLILGLYHPLIFSFVDQLFSLQLFNHSLIV